MPHAGNKKKLPQYSMKHHNRKIKTFYKKSQIAADGG
jgi:hypothetical protein